MVATAAAATTAEAVAADEMSCSGFTRVPVYTKGPQPCISVCVSVWSHVGG